MELMIVDEQHYYQFALNLLHSHTFGWNEQTLTSMRPPLYPLFVALVWAITGTESLLYVRLAQIIVSLINVYLLYRLGLLFFGRRVALWAAAGFWLYPSLMAFDFFLLTEVLFTCLLTLMALCYLTLLRTGKRSMAWGAGCALGLAALTRSILWPFPIVLCPFTFFAVPGSWKSRGQLVLYLFLGYALVIAPWAIRNTRLQGVFTVVDTMGGLNLMMGNYAHTPLNRAWDAILLQGEKSWAHALPSTAPDGSAWTEGRKEKWAQQQAITYMLAHPALTIKRAAIKFANFWGLERVVMAGWLEGAYQPPQWFAGLGAVVITLSYTLTMLLASFGFFLAPPNDRRVHLFLLSVILFVCGVHTIVFGHERYHLPLIPFILLYAVAAVVQLSRLQLRVGLQTAIAPLCTGLVLLGIWSRELCVIEVERLKAFWYLLGG
jgi:4-amino-4-deoxy-L-arabinose transferase-like glycosyltransferase